MAENSKIELTHHTFNPWRGCTKVSEGCTNCYAETMSGRNPKTLGVWGKSGTRVIASESMWKQPLKWDKAAAEAGERHRVFCASLADVFEGEDTMPDDSWRAIREARRRLFDLIIATPNLDWLLLTKRPANIETVLKTAYPTIYGLNLSGANTFIDAWMDRVWIGTSVENQEQADKRIPELLKVKAKVRFLSMEPLLGPVSLRWLPAWRREDGSRTALRCDAVDLETRSLNTNHLDGLRELDWVIVGGESGPKARPMHPDWPMAIRDQCQAAGVPFHFKQWGEWAPVQYASTAGKPLLKLSCDGKKEILLDGVNFKRLGKQVSGRLLDGREWNEVPNA